MGQRGPARASRQQPQQGEARLHSRLLGTVGRLGTAPSRCRPRFSCRRKQQPLLNCPPRRRHLAAPLICVNTSSSRSLTSSGRVSPELALRHRAVRLLQLLLQHAQGVDLFSREGGGVWGRQAGRQARVSAGVCRCGRSGCAAGTATQLHSCSGPLLRCARGNKGRQNGGEAGRQRTSAGAVGSCFAVSATQLRSRAVTRLGRPGSAGSTAWLPWKTSMK